MEDGYKPCPYCAEPIREGATVCRYCNRTLVATAPIPTPQAATTQRRRNSVAALILFGLILVLIWVIATRNKTTSPGSATSFPVPIPHPVSQKLLNGNLEVASGTYRYINFSVPAGAIRARVSGSFHAFGGSGNDIQVVIASPPEFENWINGHQAQVYYSTDKVTNGTIDRLLPPGDYTLAFDNRFSAFSRKEVTGEITLTYLQP